ncbi:heat shock protein DnaJ domain protein [Striga asiatica]|uniref:Heat shock protein DnaJ domain protein n=1 Tax=Striga asiatica TaxID=4170 RepID=A0A5A7QFP1_STRAF|nr:heat shock protein DnaJ domain protein [Striga asiatica]
MVEIDLITELNRLTLNKQIGLIVFGAGVLRVIVSRRAPGIVRRWLGSRQAFNDDLRSSFRLGDGLRVVLRWRLLMRFVRVRGLRGGLGVELIAGIPVAQDVVR